MYCCSACGGRNVEALSWVDLNSGEVEDGSEDVGEFYCRDCGASTNVDYKPDLYDAPDPDITAHQTEKPKGNLSLEN